MKNIIWWLLLIVTFTGGFLFFAEMASLTINSNFTMSAWQMIPHTWHYLVVAMVAGTLWAWLDNILKKK